MITGIDHIALAMPPGEEEPAVAFWVAVIGLERMPKPETLVGRGGVWFALPDGRQLHYGVTESFQPQKKAHPAFVSDALNALAESLSAEGYPVRWDEALAPIRRFYSEDPFGNRLEFMEAE